MSQHDQPEDLTLEDALRAQLRVLRLEDPQARDEWLPAVEQIVGRVETLVGQRVSADVVAESYEWSGASALIATILSESFLVLPRWTDQERET